jgi:hypothetical protein
MTNEKAYHIDEEIINSVGLQPSDNPVSSQLATNARVYEFPTLDNVFVMESDFYGNPMPEGSCFLAVQGKRGLMGRRLRVETLRDCRTEEIQKMAQDISEG